MFCYNSLSVNRSPIEFEIRIDTKQYGIRIHQRKTKSPYVEVEGDISKIQETLDKLCDILSRIKVQLMLPSPSMTFIVPEIFIRLERDEDSLMVIMPLDYDEFCIHNYCYKGNIPNLYVLIDQAVDLINETKGQFKST